MLAPLYAKLDLTTPCDRQIAPSPSVCPARRVHPDFASPDADIVLRSLEGTLFFLHSYILRHTSGLFSMMFTLPQPLHNTSELVEIPIYESDEIAVPLLRLLCGLPHAPWQSYDAIERVLFVAEKWDTPGPVAYIRDVLMAPRFLNSDPLRVYALAKHFGWDNEARIAATLTLKLDLHDEAYRETLNRLSAKELTPLFKLRRARREKFRELLDSPERFAAGNSSVYHCSQCGVTKLDNYTWRQLKHAIFIEMDRRPLGDTIGLAVGETAEWPVSKACWAARCPKEGCGGLYYDRISTLRQIRRCVESLPMTIDDDV
ncbi:hypothetical protein L208DRAFT_1332090 [Tricholoma matsutake]|nr:hypothetical protein L208DRAFT_1332090 [Tricholoma matsutake 945]